MLCRSHSRWLPILFCTTLGASPLTHGLLHAQDPGSTVSKATAPKAQRAPIPLNSKGTVVLDKENKRLLLKTKVVLRKGALEMLVCPVKTKEHESILAVDSKAINVHAGLLALGMDTGTPAKFDPKFVPPTGRKLKITLRWTDKAGKQHAVDARRWIRNNTTRYFAHPVKKLPAGFTLPESDDLDLRYDKRNQELLWYGRMTKQQRDKLLQLSNDKAYRKAIRSFYERTQFRRMEADWVFAGGYFITDAKTGKRRYAAETGTLICVSNFPSSTIDVAMKSSSSAGSQLYEAWTDRIPPLGTEVTVDISPVPEKKKKTDDSKSNQKETTKRTTQNES